MNQSRMEASMVDVETSRRAASSISEIERSIDSKLHRRRNGSGSFSSSSPPNLSNRTRGILKSSQIEQQRTFRLRSRKRTFTYEEGPKCTKCVIFGWTALTSFLMFLTVGIANYFLIPSTPSVVLEMMQNCSIHNISCPSKVFSFKAYQQIYLIDTQIANEFTPDDVLVRGFLGYSLGAILVIEYTDISFDATASASQPVHEIHLLQLTGKGPEGALGAFASHMFTTTDKMVQVGRRDLGLASWQTKVDLKYGCDDEESGISFHVDAEQVTSVDVCLAHSREDGFIFGMLSNHTLPNLSGKLIDDLLKLPPYQEPHDDLGSLMTYMCTFHHADLKLTSSVKQAVHGDGEAAHNLRRLLSGYVLPAATIYDNVRASTWEAAQYSEQGWVKYEAVS